MIHDVDESLRALLKREAINGSGVEIEFEAPTKDWAARRNSPTVDIYLYDIREDVERRDIYLTEIRDPNGFITARQPAPRKFRLSYLVTAWTQRAEDEHRLLSALLTCFIAHETLPDDTLAGVLRETRLPCALTIALPPPQDRSLSDVWSALGGELKPSLDLGVTVPFAVKRIKAAAPPVTAEPLLAMRREDDARKLVDVLPEEQRRRAHRVGRRSLPGEPLNENGEPRGEDGRVLRASPTPLTTAAPAQDDVVVSGRERKPGRILHVKGIKRP